MCDTANWYILVPNLTCQHCGYGCATCNNNRQCQSCRLNFYNQTAYSCVVTCADGWFENLQNNQCDACSYQCATCDDATNCVTCDANTNHRELSFVNGVQTCVCQERYFQATHFASSCSSCIN
jgi:proprotein convertase subtilisin/kexin type 5